MDTSWFYADGGERRGPVSLEEVVRVLLAAPDPRSVQVWRQGMLGWQPAGSVPEISVRLPSAPSSVPPGAQRAWPFDDAVKIAVLYRRLVLLVGLQLLLGFLRVPIATMPSQAAGVLALVFLAILLVVLSVLAVTAYRLAGALGSGPPVLWAIGMFIPCVNIIVLLALSSSAQSWCRRYGIKVGFLGPTPESIEAARKNAVGSTFD
jgi:hypothetical protein